MLVHSLRFRFLAQSISGLPRQLALNMLDVRQALLPRAFIKLTEFSDWVYCRLVGLYSMDDILRFRLSSKSTIFRQSLVLLMPAFLDVGQLPPIPPHDL